MLKKDKMVSCRAPGCTNRANKNLNIISNISYNNNNNVIITTYCSILRTMVYLMPEEYSKPCQISKKMRHIESPGIVRTVYSGIFRHSQGQSAICSHVQTYLGRLRYIEAYSGTFEAY